jgi:hypothetical protein
MSIDRRRFLATAGAGFGALAMSALAQDKSRTIPKAKSVIFLFMEGGPSAVDLLDPKPELQRLAGKPLPPSFKPLITAMGEFHSPVLPSKRNWYRHGTSGLWYSDWIPHIGGCLDDIAVIRSCVTDGINHSGGVCQMNTGTPLAGRPSLGSWVSYGLGSENRNLPGFVVLQDNPSTVVNGPRNWSAGFMPATYQGTRLATSAEPIPNLATPAAIGDARQREKLGLLDTLNRAHYGEHADVSDLDARIRSYELAFRMQAEAPEAVDLSKESDETLELYGMKDKKTEAYGRMCLLSRRLVERGVRFVQLYSGAGSKWDAHTNIEKNHAEMCYSMDKPVAGLLRDLKRRGLLDETLVIWGGEFGRTPQSEKGDGRDHNPWGFTMWMAGGGVKGGRAIGATDEVGLHAVDTRLHVHDLHATILHLLGLDHEKLVYFHKGRPERATINEGEIYKRITG